MSTIIYDHSFVFDENFKYLESLRQEGFHVNWEFFVEHPGGMICKFLTFKDPKLANPEEYQYLEFIHLSEGEVKLPPFGLALSCDTDLPQLFRAQQETWKKYKPRLVHKNYNWKTVKDKHEAGWNFINFETPPIPGVYIWFITYDPRPEKRPSPQEHPNQCNKIKSFGWPAEKFDQFKNFLSESQLEWDESFFVPSESSAFEVSFSGDAKLAGKRIEPFEDHQWAIKFE